MMPLQSKFKSNLKWHKSNWKLSSGQLQMLLHTWKTENVPVRLAFMLYSSLAEPLYACYLVMSISYWCLLSCLTCPIPISTRAAMTAIPDHTYKYKGSFIMVFKRQKGLGWQNLEKSSCRTPSFEKLEYLRCFHKQFSINLCHCGHV